ncbi:MAG TPA: ferrous iron transport protein A [Longimicrobiales bacterium]|nr:ferrous iron transport protein A [Longimicrobiales bacterium]
MAAEVTGTAPEAGLPASWSWERTLAFARAGNRYRIEEIAFPSVRRRCRALGIGVGDEITYLESGARDVRMLHEGRVVTLVRDCAWFVRVEPLGRAAD